MESFADLTARLTPAQKQQLESAGKSFGGGNYAEALAGYKVLLNQLPGDALMTKLASESALDVGDTAFALSSLRPVAQAAPDDWQATALLTRACAESGDLPCRDKAMAHMIDLHRRGITPPRMQQYIVERVKVGDNTLLIRASLEPWGPYQIYDLGQVTDASGSTFLRTTIESSDADQALFKEQHPKEAADGARSFSLDAYRETGRNSSGQRTQAHFTFKFFVGQPSYAIVREEFIHIANGTSKPISNRSGLVVP
jgi:hypothetical protein